MQHLVCKSYAGALACHVLRAWQWRHLFGCTSVSDCSRHAIPGLHCSFQAIPPRNLLEACPTPEEAWLLAGAWPASGSIALAAAVDCCGSSAWSVICTGTQVSPVLCTSDGCFTK